MCVMFNGFHLHLCIFNIMLIFFDIQCNGSDIKWKYITDLYLRNTGQVTKTSGLSLMPKIKYEHVHLTSFSKIRVDLAAQVCMVFNASSIFSIFIFKVMSETVSKALKFTGDEEAAETAQFIEMVDKRFYCLNVSTLSKGKMKSKPFVQPYHYENNRYGFHNYYYYVIHKVFVFSFFISGTNSSGVCYP